MRRDTLKTIFPKTGTEQLNHGENIFERFRNFLSKIFKLKSVEPRIATGTIALIIFIISSYIEMAIGLPLISEYTGFICIVVVVLGIFLYIKFVSHYDPKNNDNKKVAVFSFFFLLLFIIVVVMSRN